MIKNRAEERKEARRVERLAAFSIIDLSQMSISHPKRSDCNPAYRSMIVISGATRREALAAAVRSEVILHGRFLVCHCWVVRGSTRGEVWSLIASVRPSRSTVRVIICNVFLGLQCAPSHGLDGGCTMSANEDEKKSISSGFRCRSFGNSRSAYVRR